MNSYRPSPPPAMRRPATYADPGPPGWYPELQCYPRPTRLEVRYSPKWGRNVWVKPLVLMIHGLPRPVNVSEIRHYFASFRPVEVTLSKTFMGSSQGARQNVIMQFNHPLDATRAERFTHEQHRLGNRTYCVFAPEVNVTGPHAWTTDDVMLVREPVEVKREYLEPDLHLPAPVPPYDASADPRRDRPPAYRPAKRPHSPSFDDHITRETITKRIRELDPSARHDPREPSRVWHPDASFTLGSRLIPPAYSPSRDFTIGSYRPPSPRSLTPPRTAGLGPLDRFKQHLELSTHESYTEPALAPYPTWVATLGDILVVAMTRESIALKYPRACPVHIDDVDKNTLEQLGFEPVKGYRWKVKYETQRAWREGGGCVSLLGRGDEVRVKAERF